MGLSSRPLQARDAVPSQYLISVRASFFVYGLVSLRRGLSLLPRANPGLNLPLHSFFLFFFTVSPRYITLNYLRLNPVFKLLLPSFFPFFLLSIALFSESCLLTYLQPSCDLDPDIIFTLPLMVFPIALPP